jgi:Cu-Zn family superoxide dismutase
MNVRVIVPAAALALAACASPRATEHAGHATHEAAAAPALGRAFATIEARSGSQTSGTAEFTALPDGGTRVVVKVSGLTPGPHGIHLHEAGDCSAPDAASAGPHWNPGKHEHGGPGEKPHHAGDLGNLIAGADGAATLTMDTTDFTVGGAQGVVGRSVVVHEKVDDLVSQPAGNSGARIGCGVIQAG